MKKVLLMVLLAAVLVTGCGSKEEKRTRVKSHYNVSVKVLLVTPYGLTEGVNTGLIQAVIKAEDLFVNMV